MLRGVQQIEIRAWRVGPGKAVLLWLGTSIFLSAILLPLMAMDEDIRQFEREEVLVGLGFSLIICLVAVAGVYQALRERAPCSYLRLEPDVVSWQWPPASAVEIRYENLWVAQCEGRGRGERLVLRPRGTGAGIQVRVRDLSEPALVEPILDSILERVRALPEGLVLQEEISKRRALAALTNRRPVATWCMTVVLVLVFFVEVATGALQEPSRLLALGANSAERVADGELFRLATANLLHGSLSHLMMNAAVLLGFGALIEPLVGSARFLTIFLASSLAGAAASALLAQHAISVGASTGISGLLGAYAVILKLRPEQLPIAPAKGDWIRLVAAFALPPLLIPKVDNAGHMGGLAAGLLLMFAALWKSDLVELQRRHRLFSRVAAGVLIVLFLASAAVIFGS
jgi:rhomboid protease GluP